MNISIIILLTAAGLAVALALRVVYGEKTSIPTLAFAIGLGLLALEAVLGALGLAANSHQQALKWYSWRFLPLSFVPAVWLLFAVTYARGNYRQFWKRWMPVITALAIAAPFAALAFHEHLFDEISGRWRLGYSGRLVQVCLVLGATAVLMNIERTFHASVGLMRWRLKFMVIGLSALFLTRIYTSTQVLIFSSVNASFDVYNAVALILFVGLGFLSLRRAQGFNLDLYPSPTLVYRSVAVLLVGGYLLAVGFLADAVRYMGGSTSFPFQAFLLLIGLVVLGLLLVSDRVRLWVKRFVSTHLRRPVYDVGKVWRTFSEATAGQLDETQLSRATVKWIAEGFDTLSVTLWLVPPQGGQLLFGASTSISEDAAIELIQSKEGIPAALEKLKEHAAPIDIDASREAWVETARLWHPAKFSHGGNRFCIPVISAGELTGVMMLGDRVAGVPFSAEELDLLKCIAGQVAGDLVRLRLSHHLAEAKEIQAFQTMATFFVHDLKNTASTLSLLVQNLREHFDRPDFREDAVRALSKSVGRINDLITRLGSLRQEFRMNLVPAELAEVVAAALKDFEGLADTVLVKTLHPTPRTMIDAEQMQRVVANLVLNAKEATKGTGEIRVGTEPNGRFAVLTVRDQGCGMSPEFMKRQLFRPFQTTKVKGIGIGMFHTKMIVEAHGGRIQVESVQGQGTTFRVLLPLLEGEN